MSLALVFPGQGSQQVGMGKALAEAFPECRAVFALADDVLGFPLGRLCFEGPEEQLRLTANTQPAILATSVAAWRALASTGVHPDWVAGHSLGEYSALVAAGALDLADALVTVRRRGEYMQSAVPPGEGAMAAILALDLPAIEQACLQAGGEEVVAPASFNAPGQVVIAGHTAAVERAMSLCRSAGARSVVALPVSAPFHCSLMKPAQARLEADLRALAFRDPRPPLIRNLDARGVRDAEACREGLIRQVSAPVLWQQSVEALVSEGVDTFIEVGPGTVLSGLVRKTARGARMHAVGDPATLDRTRAALEVGCAGLSRPAALSPLGEGV